MSENQYRLIEKKADENFIIKKRVLWPIIAQKLQQSGDTYRP
jgi:hypothetical protein